HIGSPNAYSFNVPTVTGSGMTKTNEGKAEKRTFTQLGGMCPRCEGMGNINDIDLTQIYDDSKSLAEGAITVPGYTADGWMVKIYAASGFVDPNKPIRDFTKKELDDFLYKEPVKVKVDSINLTYEGLISKIQKSLLS